jgi:hypothetical protein
MARLLLGYDSEPKPSRVRAAFSSVPFAVMLAVTLSSALCCDLSWSEPRRMTVGDFAAAWSYHGFLYWGEYTPWDRRTYPWGSIPWAFCFAAESSIMITIYRAAKPRASTR